MFSLSRNMANTPRSGQLQEGEIPFLPTNHRLFPKGHVRLEHSMQKRTEDFRKLKKATVLTT